MKDPTTVGTVLSAGTLFVLSVWKTRRLRWIAIGVASALLIWAVSSEASVDREVKDDAASVRSIRQ
jgi:hypothetical protein